MKKLLLTALVMLGLAMSAQAGPLRNVPTGPAGTLPTADYGGVSYATSTFAWSGATLGNASTACVNIANFTCHGVFYGVIFSTGDNSQFVDVFDSTSTDVGVRQGAITRLYNINASTGGQNASPTGGFSGPPKPIRFSEGLIIRPNSGANNLITTLYNAEP